MRRREFMTLCAGAAIAGPGTAFAQPASRIYRLGTLAPSAPIGEKSPFGTVLLQALEQRGYVLGRNLALDGRSAAGDSITSSETGGTALVLTFFRLSNRAQYFRKSAGKTCGNLRCHR